MVTSSCILCHCIIWFSFSFSLQFSFASTISLCCWQSDAFFSLNCLGFTLAALIADFISSTRSSGDSCHRQPATSLVVYIHVQDSPSMKSRLSVDLACSIWSRPEKSRSVISLFLGTDVVWPWTLAAWSPDHEGNQRIGARRQQRNWHKGLKQLVNKCFLLLWNIFVS